MIYDKELTDKIIGCAIEVHRSLGSSYLEKLYERALMIELADQGLKAECQVPIQVKYKNQIIGDHVLDIVVEDRVILELKACAKIHPAHEAQLIQYLHAAKKKVGYVINFGSEGRLEFVRKVL